MSNDDRRALSPAEEREMPEEPECMSVLRDGINPPDGGIAKLLSYIDALRAYTLAAGRDERKLTKIAQVGNGVFHVGVSERLVIERAQRQYEYEQTPERQALRKEQLENFRTAIDAALKDAG